MRFSYENRSIQLDAGIVTLYPSGTMIAAAPEGTPTRRIGD